jgi:hypothetical protein
MKRQIMALLFGAAPIAIGVGVAASVLSTPALAQDPAHMSCRQLWHARNAIYARNGYCFETARARAVFGRGCFPPYGELRGWERNRVGEIKMWERRKGC